jgi:hypothetical protein
MIKNSLRAFVAGAIENKRITENDVRKLQREVLADGITSREEADTLIALERALPEAEEAFADYLVAAVVDFAVWGARPTGYVDNDTAAGWPRRSPAARVRPRPPSASPSRSSRRRRRSTRRFSPLLCAARARVGAAARPSRAHSTPPLKARPISSAERPIPAPLPELLAMQ